MQKYGIMLLLQKKVYRWLNLSEKYAACVIIAQFNVLFSFLFERRHNINEGISLMKQQLVLTHQYSFTGGRNEIDRSSKDQHLCMLRFYETTRTSKNVTDTTFWQKVCP